MRVIAVALQHNRQRVRLAGFQRDVADIFDSRRRGDESPTANVHAWRHRRAIGVKHVDVEKRPQNHRRVGFVFKFQLGNIEARVDERSRRFHFGKDELDAQAVGQVGHGHVVSGQTIRDDGDAESCDGDGNQAADGLSRHRR